VLTVSLRFGYIAVRVSLARVRLFSAVDLGRADESLWAVIRVESGISTDIEDPHASDAAAAASATHRRLLSGRIERKLMEYLESLHRTSAFDALDAASRASIDRALRTVPHD
jgi:hypothetical protein